MIQIIIDIDTPDSDLVSILESTDNLNFTKIKREKLSGESVVSIILGFSAGAFTQISKIIIESIKSKKITSIQWKDFKITNISEEKAIDLMNQISKENNLELKIKKDTSDKL